MKIKTFALGNYQSNCYIVSKEKDALVIDPGYPDSMVTDYLKEHELNVKIIYLTHGHLDHWGGTKMIQDAYPDALTYASQKDSYWYELGPQNPWKYTPKIDHFVKENDELVLKDIIFKIYETPGHSNGGTVLFSKPHLFAGDTLFKESIGRTDLAYGSFDEIRKSILRLYDMFSNETIVYPGHGPKTTIGHEKQFNPFVNLRKKH